MVGEEMPVDVERVCDKCGYRISIKSMPIFVRGVSLPRHATILLNRRLSRRARRYYLAHELGEMFRPSMKGVSERVYNQFAGHLLIPPRDLLCRCGKSAFSELQSLYDVTDSVLGMQLKLIIEYQEWHRFLDEH